MTDFPLSEPELLMRIASGDEVAFSIIFKKHWQAVFRYLEKTTKSSEVAEDIVSDIFLKLWTNREQAVDIKNFEAFLKTVARNKAMDFFRMAAKDAKLQDFLALQIKNSDSQSADHLVLQHEHKELLEQAIGRLSPQRKLVFTLSKEEGLSHKEIAQRTNLSHQTVKNTLNSALKAIRAYLRAHQIDPFIICLIISSLF